MQKSCDFRPSGFCAFKLGMTFGSPSPDNSLRAETGHLLVSQGDSSARSRTKQAGGSSAPVEVSPAVIQGHGFPVAPPWLENNTGHSGRGSGGEVGEREQALRGA